MGLPSRWSMNMGSPISMFHLPGWCCQSVKNCLSTNTWWVGETASSDFFLLLSQILNSHHINRDVNLTMGPLWTTYHCQPPWTTTNHSSPPLTTINREFHHQPSPAWHAELGSFATSWRSWFRLPTIHSCYTPVGDTITVSCSIWVWISTEVVVGNSRNWVGKCGCYLLRVTPTECKCYSGNHVYQNIISNKSIITQWRTNFVRAIVIAQLVNG